jgi:hypothetical protein
MNEVAESISPVEQFIAKWPTEKVARIQDPISREMMVDLAKVVGQIEAKAEDAAHQAERAHSRATWGLFGGWG